MPAAKLVGDKSYSILTDHLGTPYEAYDEEGKKVWARELDLYGNAITGDSSFIPFLYQGQYYDEEIGLAYNRFRYYSPESGTYISQDPIGLAGGLAFYGYVMDCNGWIDPWGLEKILISQNNRTIDLTNSEWRNVTFDGNQEGIVYVLRDNDTGELLKVGKTETTKFKGRFEIGATIGSHSGPVFGIGIISKIR